ncbi:ABC transporter substrate-binding protein [Amycolatopsis jejuensis]|uniref:ABC transporter substrate-binding protein n=1 Tax=Amycolatopsis jejuensis TaxID=330084 RepID=UPI000A017A88|nr:ABC transporter substrate-binding protein [Amycolatopsis jejuensis]
MRLVSCSAGSAVSLRVRRRLSAVGAVMLLFLAAACSGSSGAASGGGSTWKIGAIVDQTGPGAAAYAGTAQVLQAWVKHTNQQGGINGHQLELVLKDSKSTPAGGLQAAGELVRDKVIALVQGGSLVASAWAKPLAQAGIPVICGAPAASPPYGTEKNFYPCVPSAATSTGLIAKAALQSGYRSIGVVACVEAPVCGQTAKAMQESGEKAGVPVVVQSTSLSAPSFAAPCLALKDAHAELVFAIAPPDTTFSIIDSCGQQNYRPAYVAGQLSNKFLTNSNLGGFVGLTETAPYFADLPALKTFRDVMQAEAPDAYTGHPDTSATVWASGELFKRAAETGKLADAPTATDVAAALDKLSGETVDGLTAPLTFTNGNRTVSCGFVVSIKDGKFADPFGTKPVCPPAS